MTFEKSRANWNSGFRGYKDNSVEALHRRYQQDMEIKMNSVFRSKKVAKFLYGKFGELIAYGQTSYRTNELKKLLK